MYHGNDTNKHNNNNNSNHATNSSSSNNNNNNINSNTSTIFVFLTPCARIRAITSACLVIINIVIIYKTLLCCY